VNIHTQR